MSNIVEQVIATPPSSYEAYLYRYTNVTPNKAKKVYIGIHKGSVDDSYSHSSKNSEFQKAFSNSKSKLKFEVLEYGSYMEMQNTEHRMLKKVDARKNSLYYNKSNGFPQFAEPDIENCEFINQQINDGVFPVTIEDLSLHVDMAALQVRFQHDPELQRTIKQKIDDARGCTSLCTPVLVWVGRGKNGEDIRGDGNHTVHGASKSKHAVDIPVMRIPYAVHCELTDEELRFIGNLRNKRAEITKKEMSESDAIKYVLDMAAKGVPFNSQSNVNALKALGFTKGQIKTVLNKSDQIIATQKALTSSGRLFINYKATPHDRVLTAKVNSLSQPHLGQCSTYFSSGAFRVERALELMTETNCKRCAIVIHHPSVSQSKKWKTQIQPKWMNILSNFGIDVEFVEMDMWMDDISKKNYCEEEQAA
tara:strand:- start:2039 stop:3295 length:1257 start_codon:yes stop_codon:yes gene_type:complete